MPENAVALVFINPFDLVISDAENGGVDEFGLRFLEFHGEGHERIENVLTRACVNP